MRFLRLVLIWSPRSSLSLLSFALNSEAIVGDRSDWKRSWVLICSPRSSGICKIGLIKQDKNLWSFLCSRIWIFDFIPIDTRSRSQQSYHHLSLICPGTSIFLSHWYISLWYTRPRLDPLDYSDWMTGRAECHQRNSGRRPRRAWRYKPQSEADLGSSPTEHRSADRNF